MSDWPTGTPINLVERFWVVDPITEVSTLKDPTHVTFQVESMLADGTMVEYHEGDPQVSNPSVGVWVCALPAQQPGNYVWRCIGTGAVEATSGDHSFNVYDSAIEPDIELAARPGPCQPWITGEDVANSSDSDLGVGSDTWRLDEVAVEASSVMWELSGRRYNGLCIRKVRPCAQSCGCWGDHALGTTPWSWTLASWGGTWPPFWVSEGGDKCGCNSLSVVRLAGYPVRRVLEVKIDGVVMPERDDNGDLNWRLDRHRNLVRMDSPDTAIGRRMWPGCQNLALEDTQNGTFAVKYEWGLEAPTMGKQAAAELARELWNATHDRPCKLPDRAVKIVRQGVTIERVGQTAKTLKEGATGMTSIDAFLASLGNTVRRPAVWSPDKQRFARKVG